MNFKSKGGWPWWAYRTKRQFKTIVRGRIRNALKALEETRNGCVFTPDRGDKLRRAYKLIEQFAKECAIKKWGR